MFFAQSPAPPASVLGYAFAVMIVVVVFIYSLRIMREYERAVVFRLGRLIGEKGPGWFILIPFVDRMEKVDMRTLTYDVPPQDIITRDNVSVKVNAVIYFRVVNPTDAINKVENYQYATRQMAQTKLRDVLGQVELDDLLANRDKINEQLQSILDLQTDPWGIKVTMVDLKHVDLPPEMVRIMAKQAEAERERRAKIISAEGEFQASARLGEAAEVLGRHPIAIQLRYLQTLVEVAGANQSSTTLFPLPLDMMKPFFERQSQQGAPTPLVSFSDGDELAPQPEEEKGPEDEL